MSDPMSTTAAAKSLGVTYNQLMGWVYRGKIQASRWGRYWTIAVEEVERVRAELT